MKTLGDKWINIACFTAAILACAPTAAPAVKQITIQSLQEDAANQPQTPAPPPPPAENAPDPFSLIQQGRQLAAQGKNGEASLLFMRVYTERPDHAFAPVAMVEAARAVLADGRPLDSAKILEAAIDRYPDNRDVISSQLTLASVYAMLGEPEKGVAPLKLLIDKGVGQEPAEATRNLVELYFSLGRTYEGETLAEKHITKNPGDVHFLFMLADSYRKNEQFDTAIKIFEKLLAAQPQNTAYENEYFATLKEAGKLDAEIKRVRALYDKNTADMTVAHKLKRMYLWNKDSLDALVILQNIVERQPDNLEDAVLLAKQYYANQWKKRAKELLEKIVAKRPGYEPAWREIGNIYFQEKEVDNAIDAWKNAAGFNPQDEPSYRRMANYLSPKYLYAELTAIYEEGRANLKNPMVFAHDLAALYNSQMMREKALGEYINIVLMQPNDYNARRQMIDAALMDGLEKSGPEMLEAALARNPDSQSIAIGLLCVLMERGREKDSFSRMRGYADRTGAPVDFLVELAAARGAAGNFMQASEVYAEAAKNAGAKRPYCLLQEGRSRLSGGDRDGAVAAFKRLVAESPDEPGVDEAVMLIAQTYDDDGDPAAARIWYTRLVTDYPESAWRNDALVLEARSAFRSGDFSSAATSFKALATMPGARGRLDEILYYSAMTDLFAFKFDDAKKGFSKIIDQYPESDWVNDALEKIMFLQDAEDIDGIRMQAIISAEKEWIKGDRDAAESILSGLVMTLSDGNMKGHAILRLAAIRQNSGRYQEAIETLEKMSGAECSEELVARSLYMAGEIYIEMKQNENALKKFQELSMNYPGSYWSGKARRLAGTIVIE